MIHGNRINLFWCPRNKLQNRISPKLNGQFITAKLSRVANEKDFMQTEESFLKEILFKLYIFDKVL